MNNAYCYTGEITSHSKRNPFAFHVAGFVFCNTIVLFFLKFPFINVLLSITHFQSHTQLWLIFIIIIWLEIKVSWEWDTTLFRNIDTSIATAYAKWKLIMQTLILSYNMMKIFKTVINFVTTGQWILSRWPEDVEHLFNLKF